MSRSTVSSVAWQPVRAALRRLHAARVADGSRTRRRRPKASAASEALQDAADARACVGVLRARVRSSVRAPRHRPAAGRDRGALRRPLAGAAVRRAARGFRPHVDCYRTDDPPSSWSSSSCRASTRERSRSSVEERLLTIAGQRRRPRVAGRVYQQMEIEYGAFGRRAAARPRTSTSTRRARDVRARDADDHAADRRAPARGRGRARSRSRMTRARTIELLRAGRRHPGREPPILPVLPLKETVVFPESMTPLAIGQERSSG